LSILTGATTCIAGEFGEGALRINGATADYYSVASASVGLTPGVARHSEMILSRIEFLQASAWHRALALPGEMKSVRHRQADTTIPRGLNNARHLRHIARRDRHRRFRRTRPSESLAPLVPIN
jgi:hypothetical protein